MEINIKDITNGKMNGRYVWICDYRPSKGGINDKPIRHVKPQKVLVRSNEETKERVYYSESHFAVLNKNGKALKKIIKPFDSTGYRWYPGIPVRVFNNEEECIAQYEKFYKIMNPKIEAKFTFKEIIEAGLCIIEPDGNLLNEEMLIKKLDKCQK